jgi:cysteinyl-tRNA synthetase
VLHELAGEINSNIEQSRAEHDRPPHLIKTFAAATQTMRRLGMLLGLFRTSESHASEQKTSALADQLMELILTLRAEARKKKDFAAADMIRDGLAKLEITVEDRPDGSIWRKD